MEFAVRKNSPTLHPKGFVTPAGHIILDTNVEDNSLILYAGANYLTVIDNADEYDVDYYLYAGDEVRITL